MSTAAVVAVESHAAPPVSTTIAREFLAPVHAFRGFAIVAIVAAHSWSLLILLFGAIVPAFGPVAPAPATLIIALTAETLFHDSTIFFALISGLLFTRVLNQRGWGTFFRSKLINVAIPYAIVSALIMLYNADAATFRLTPFSGSWRDYLAELGTNLLTGGAFFHLWYIPVLFVLYALTPVVLWLLMRPSAKPLVWVTVAAPLFASRVWPDLSWTNPVYFLGSYTVGMWAGLRYESVMGLIGRKRGWLALVALVTTVAIAAMFVGEFDKVGPVSLRESTWYIQKLAIAGLVLAWLGGSGARYGKLLDPLATFAFPIYFIHAYVLALLGELLLAAGVTQMPPLAILAGGFAVWCITSMVSLAIAYGARVGLGRRSRLLIGA